MSDTTYFVVAVAAIIFKEDRILAMKRSLSKDAGPGLWETLSGRVEEGEDPLDAVTREIEEECGLEVEVDPRPVKAYHAARNNDPMILILYRANYKSGSVRLSEEHDEYAWLTPDEFAEVSTLDRLVDVVYETLDLQTMED
jgi:8-oxo-dGTP diphosphatase